MSFTFTNEQLALTLMCSPTAIKCPICNHKEEAPPVRVSDQLGAALGMSGHALATVHADQVFKRVVNQMRSHMRTHSVDDWLLALLEAKDRRS